MIEETKQVIDSEITILQDGDVASPNGYTAGGIHVGLRRAKKDFGWLYSSNPAQCAAVYTQNAFKAAPLQVTQASLNVSKQLSAVVINSAIANACTGERGLRDAIQTKKWISEKLQLPEHEIAVASTGLIGEFLPMDKIKYGVEHIDIEGATCSKDFNESILTTDKETKHIAVQVTIDGEVITVGGSSKGSGMINPNMATMLGFMTTDANVQAEDLEDILKPTVDDTFNMITVDGDTSTNDMVLLLANGMVGKQQLTKEHPEWHKFSHHPPQTHCPSIPGSRTRKRNLPQPPPAGNKALPLPQYRLKFSVPILFFFCFPWLTLLLRQQSPLLSLFSALLHRPLHPFFLLLYTFLIFSLQLFSQALAVHSEFLRL